MKIVMYDPPEGWKYGFPKQYKPLHGESEEETLRRDGYPEKLLQQGMAKYCRFWEREVTGDEYDVVRRWHGIR